MYILRGNILLTAQKRYSVAENKTFGFTRDPEPITDCVVMKSNFFESWSPPW